MSVAGVGSGASYRVEGRDTDQKAGANGDSRATDSVVGVFVSANNPTEAQELIAAMLRDPPRKYDRRLQGNASHMPSIFPEHLIYPENYRSRVPMLTALERFKQKYPEKFTDSADERAHQIFLKYLKAYSFWLEGRGVATVMEIECHQEIQAIRAHLWEVIQDDLAEQRREYANQIHIRAIMAAGNCLRSKPAKILFAVALIICIGILLARYI